jgi:maltose alpha-D-glucosyltransferase/alpha-amylase
MSEDLSLPDRVAVRTPMQWTADANGGFSTAPPELVEPAPIRDGSYGPQNVNVADQELQPGSLLSRVSQLAGARRALGALPMRHCEAVPFDGAPAVLGVLHQRADDAVLMLVNLSGDEVQVRIPYDVHADLLADGPYEPATVDVRLAGNGYRWLRVGRSPTRRSGT